MTDRIHFGTRDGRVLRAFSEQPDKSYAMNAHEAELLLAQLRLSAKAGDWWGNIAHEMAEELAACIAETRASGAPHTPASSSPEAFRSLFHL